MSSVTRKSIFRKHGYTTDSGLLRRMAAEDEQAWIDFDNKYRRMIYGIGQKRGIDPDDYDDLVQEVMLVCCQRIGSFFYDRNKGHFRSWLFAVTRNAAWRMIRRKQTPDPELIPEYDNGIDREFMAQYEQFLTESVMKLLKERVSTQTYSAFEMMTIQQLPIKDVSRITRKSAPVLYLIRHRCLRILRQCIQEIPEAADRIHSKGSSTSKA